MPAETLEATEQGIISYGSVQESDDCTVFS